MQTLIAARVLLADGGRDTSELLRQLLMREGAYVLNFSNGAPLRRALDVMPPPEIVLLSLSLPGDDSLDLLRSLRASAAWRQVPVIAIDAAGDGKAIARAFDMGADDFVSKPISPAELLLRVKKRLAERAAPNMGGGVDKVNF